MLRATLIGTDLTSEIMQWWQPGSSGTLNACAGNSVVGARRSTTMRCTSDGSAPPPSTAHSSVPRRAKILRSTTPGRPLPTAALASENSGGAPIYSRRCARGHANGEDVLHSILCEHREGTESEVAGRRQPASPVVVVDDSEPSDQAPERAGGAARCAALDRGGGGGRGVAGGEAPRVTGGRGSRGHSPGGHPCPRLVGYCQPWSWPAHISRRLCPQCAVHHVCCGHVREYALPSGDS